MADDLIEHKERIGWAQGEINSLQAAIDAFIASGAYKFSHDVDPETGDGIFYVQLDKPIPRAFAIKAGSIAHELRATLDSLACTLAIRNEKTINQVYFPVCEDEAEFLDKDKGAAKIHKLKLEDRATIASFKPWKSGNPLLYGLHIADRTRKHQRLIAVGTNTGSVGLGFNSNGTVRFLKANVEVVPERTAFMRISKGSYMDVHLGVDVLFAEPAPVQGRPVDAVLGDFASLTKTIIESFD